MSSLHSYELRNSKIRNSAIKPPENFQCWSKKLPEGSIFISPGIESRQKVRPTWGQNVYFCDAGNTLVILAKEKSGEIRAVVYKNLDSPYNQNMWSISEELPSERARELFAQVHNYFEQKQQKHSSDVVKKPGSKKQVTLKLLDSDSSDKMDAA